MDIFDITEIKAGTREGRWSDQEIDSFYKRGICPDPDCREGSCAPDEEDS